MSKIVLERVLRQFKTISHPIKWSFVCSRVLEGTLPTLPEYSSSLAYVMSHLSFLSINFLLSPRLFTGTPLCLWWTSTASPGLSAGARSHAHSPWPDCSFQSKSVTPSCRPFSGITPPLEKAPHFCLINPWPPTPGIHPPIHSFIHSFFDQLDQCACDILCVPEAIPGTEA